MIDFRWLLAFKKLTYETRKLETLETPIFTLKFTTYLVLTPKCISIQSIKSPKLFILTPCAPKTNFIRVCGLEFGVDGLGFWW